MFNVLVVVLNAKFALNVSIPAVPTNAAPSSTPVVNVPVSLI